MNKKTRQVQVRFDPGLYAELHGELIKQNVFVADFFNYIAKTTLSDKKHLLSICNKIKNEMEKENEN